MILAIRNKIGYPDHWRDYSALEVKPDDYFGNVTRSYRFERTPPASPASTA